MSSLPIAVGQSLTENEVNAFFHCQPFKGIRLGSLNGKSVIVIMSGSAKKKIYDDVWEDNCLLYNGADVSSNNEATLP